MQKVRNGESQNETKETLEAVERDGPGDGKYRGEAEGMRPGAVNWDDLPADVRRELGMSDQKKSASRVTAWKDIPSSDGWQVCKPHGLAWRGPYPCVYCEEERRGTDGITTKDGKHTP